MSRNQVSLNNAIEDTHKQTDSPVNTSNTSNNSQQTVNFSEVHNLIHQRGRIHFLGLEGHDDAEYPEYIQPTSPIHSETPLAFNDVIKSLPEAEERDILGVNKFVNDDGTLDINALESESGIDLNDVSVNPETVTQATKNPKINSYKDIVDPRREALAGLGADIKYRWQVASDKYSIINPTDAYYPAYKTFKEKGESESIFGWVDIRDWGGKVDMYIFFSDHTVEHPNDKVESPIYIGLRTGYDFTGGRALDVSLFGYDPDEEVRYYALGERRTRKHIGDPTDSEHERKQGRTPIKDWWETEYENLLTWTDELVHDIERASNTTIEFKSGDIDFGIADFYSYIGIPDSYIHEPNETGKLGSVKRAKRHSGSTRKYSMWTLFYALSNTLEKEFQGQDRTGAAYKVYADIATKILRSPETMIRRAKQEHELEQIENENNEKKSERERVLDNDTTQLTDIGSVSELEGVETEDEMGITDRRQFAKESQKKLFNFEEE